ncbi:unnamed protein product [Oreochromis niloticus]|nr:unnamed protein product [Mustela putorius furo]
MSCPPVKELLDLGPALKMESELYAEFQRITNQNLPNTFYAELDRHLPRLMTLFRQKASKTGKTADALAEILRIHDEQEIHDIHTKRTTVLHALPVYLREDVSGFFRTCTDESDELELDGVEVALFTVISDHDTTSPVHYQPVKISVVIESDAVVSLPRFGEAFLNTDMSAVTASIFLTLLFVGVFVFVSADQKTITAASGQDVILPCRAPNKNTNKFVQWSRADLEPEYFLVYRDGKFLPNNQHPSFKNRMDLQDRRMKDGDVSLILKDVSSADTGSYVCRAFMEETRSWKPISIINLNVPPDIKTVTAVPGQDVTLTCRAPNNNNIKYVHWSRADLEPEYLLVYRNGQFFPENQHPSFQNRVDLQDRQMKDGDASLILKDVNTADNGTYECRIFMEETRSWKLSIINLSVPSDEQHFITAKSGQIVILPCLTPKKNIKFVHWSRADLEPEYLVLYKDGKFLPENQHPSFKNRVDLQERQMKDGDVSLILNNVNTADKGTYQCRVFTEGARTWKTISIINLSVPPDQKVIATKSGQNVILPCQNPANKIKAVRWSRVDLEPEYLIFYRAEQFLPNNQNESSKHPVALHERQIKDGDVSLILNNVNTADNGTYVCRVFTEETRSWKSISIIDLNVPPDQKNITAESRRSVILPCGAPNNKKIKFIHWSRADLEPEYLLVYQNGQYLLDNQHPSFKNRVDLQDIQMKGGDVSLILKNVNTADDGTYQCRVFMEETRSWKLSIINLNISLNEKNVC